ncbi:MAG TPA: MCE family protein, partial [Candidatus Saccharimonadales bacterium]|nr:MCE family protein [Candidatus Saccharimonadales bacterium]
MSLQDLTPQLRTRLSRLERVVGFFVIVAALLLLAGLAFYIYRTAERKGWFLKKLPYYTFVRSAAGLKIGQPVKLMGLDVGEIVDIQPQPPEDSYYDMFVAFWVKEPYYGYLWEDSRARIGATDFLGNRFIELTKGTNGPSTYLFRPFREVPLSEM